MPQTPKTGGQIELSIERHLHYIRLDEFQLWLTVCISEFAPRLLEHSGAEIDSDQSLTADAMQKFHACTRSATDIQGRVRLANGVHRKPEHLIGGAKWARIELRREQIVALLRGTECLPNQFEQSRAVFCDRARSYVTELIFGNSSSSFSYLLFQNLHRVWFSSRSTTNTGMQLLSFVALPPDSSLPQ
jgi:hypothetical protein